MEIKRSGSQPSAKDPPSGSPEQSASIRVRRARSGSRCRRERHVRARGADGVAHAPARPDADRHIRRWPRPALGGPVEEIRPGDVVWFPPGEKHWHGASPTTAMTHIAIQEKLDGKPVDWLEHVTAEQYEGRSDAS